MSPYDLNTDEINHRISHFLNSQSYAGQKTLVLSHERLSGNPHAGGFDGQILSKRIKAVFPKAKILIVIREQRSFILSNYFQYLKLGGRHKLKYYLNTIYDRKVPSFSPNHINYLFAVKQYHDLFGKDNVLVLPFELFVSDPADYIKRLGLFINRDIKVDANEFERIVNKGEKYLSSYYLRSITSRMRSSSLNNYRKSSKALHPVWKIFDKIISLFSSKKKEKNFINSMKKDINEYCGDRYKESNKELGEILDLDLSTYGYY